MNFTQTMYNKLITFKLSKFLKTPDFLNMGLCMS